MGGDEYLVETVSAYGDCYDGWRDDAEETGDDSSDEGLLGWQASERSNGIVAALELTLVFHSINPSLTTWPDNVAVMDALWPA